MQEQGQPIGNQMSRPQGRPTAMSQPIQRGNYGISARPATPQPQPLQRPAMQSAPVSQPVAPAAPQPTQAPIAPAVQSVVTAPRPVSATPQFMDFAPSRPVAAAQPTALTQQHTALAPAFDVMSPTAGLTTEEKRPLFTPSATAAPQKEQKTGKHLKKVTVIKYGLASVAIILLIAGGVRFTSAGNTSGDTIAVGAVSANDGRSMTIQFTATDGKLHKFSTASNRSLIPGTAVELAYRSGAPEATVRQVSVIKDGRNMGMLIVMAGVALLAVVGIMVSISKLKDRNKRNGSSLTTPVTV